MLGQFKWVYAFAQSRSAATSPIGSAGDSCICASLFVWSAVTWWTGQVDHLYGTALDRGR